MEFCVFDFVYKNDSDDKYFDVSESVSHFISFQENENEESENIYFSNNLKLNSNELSDWKYQNNLLYKSETLEKNKLNCKTKKYEKDLNKFKKIIRTLKYIKNKSKKISEYITSSERRKRKIMINLIRKKNKKNKIIHRKKINTKKLLFHNNNICNLFSLCNESNISINIIKNRCLLLGKKRKNF